MPAAGRSAPTVAAEFVLGAVQKLPPARRALLFAQCGIAPQPQGRVPAAAFAALWLAVAAELDDEFFGLDARRMKPGSFALLCRALVGQPTVERALKLALRGFGLFLDDLHATLSLHGREARLVIDNRIAAPQARRFADEALLVMLHGLLCWLAGRRVPLARLELAHPRPGHAAEYPRMFSPQLRFDAPRTLAVFDARVLAVRPGVDAAALKAFLRDAPMSVFLKQVADAHAGLGERLRRRLRRAGGRLPTLGQVAAELGLSEATLRRRLQAEGVPWQRLKTEWRREQALRLLGGDGDLGVAEVAARLGYEEPSAFHRAFRQWTGQTPAAWRRRAQASAPPRA